MQNAKKMLLVSPDVMNRVRGLGDVAMDSLDEQMHKILNLKSISDVEKWKLYKEVLDKYLSLVTLVCAPLKSAAGRGVVNYKMRNNGN